MILSRDIRRSFAGKATLLSPADQPAINVDYKIELSGVWKDADTDDGRNRLPDRRTAKGMLALNSQEHGPLDPSSEYLLVLDNQFECRVRAKPRKKPLTYDVEGAVTKAPA